MIGLTQLEKDRMYKEWCRGMTLERIAQRHNVSIKTVWNAIDCRPRLHYEGDWENDGKGQDHSRPAARSRAPYKTRTMGAQRA